MAKQEHATMTGVGETTGALSYVGAVNGASKTSAAKLTVTVTLDSDVHAYFDKLATEDERSLSKFLARKLKQVYTQEQTHDEFGL